MEIAIEANQKQFVTKVEHVKVTVAIMHIKTHVRGKQ